MRINIAHIHTKGAISMKKGAFTLIELLVVIAIIAILMAILMPALNIAKDQARRIHCISNVKSLTLAWLLYKDDNDDKLVGGLPQRQSDAWMLGPQGNHPNPLERAKEGLRQGKLFEYTKKVEVYECPSDERRKRPNHMAYGSYSVAGGMNGEEKEWNNRALYTYAEIEHPARNLVFVEEIDPRGWNMGSWVMDPEGNNWIDPLAIWHSKSKGVMSYADGHAIIHTWENKDTIELATRAAEGDTGVFNHTPPSDQREDIEFMHKGYAVLPEPRR